MQASGRDTPGAAGTRSGEHAGAEKRQGHGLGAGSHSPKPASQGRIGNYALIQGKIDASGELVCEMAQHGVGFSVLIGHVVSGSNGHPIGPIMPFVHHHLSR